MGGDRMHTDRKELEMRIDGLGSEPVRDAALQALRRLDPDATLRRDEVSGIAHIVTTSQALEVEDALVRAGLQVTATTG
jgi:hypothetical protein